MRVAPHPARDDRAAGQVGEDVARDDDIDRAQPDAAGIGARIISDAERILAEMGEYISVDRKSVVQGKSVSVRVDFGCRRFINKKNQRNYFFMYSSSFVFIFLPTSIFIYL